jgi:hypothetical protein
MFIAREDSPAPAPCEGAEVKLSGTIQFRAAPSHGVGGLNAGARYKDATPNESVGRKSYTTCAKNFWPTLAF